MRENRNTKVGFIVMGEDAWTPSKVQMFPDIYASLEAAQHFTKPNQGYGLHVISITPVLVDACYVLKDFNEPV